MPWRFVSALSFTQLISYGTLFYAFALIIEPMERELGWSKTALTAAYSIFATLGTNARPRLITRVEDRAGVVIWSRPPVSTPALSPAVAYIVTSTAE